MRGLIFQTAYRLNVNKTKFYKLAKENLHHLSIVFAAPFEPTLQQDTIVYRDKESGQYYKLVRLRK